MVLGELRTKIKLYRKNLIRGLRLAIRFRTILVNQSNILLFHQEETLNHHIFHISLKEINPNRQLLAY